MEKPQTEPTEQPVTEEQRHQPPVHRKKRSQLPLNIDDYEKRRSARSVSKKEKMKFPTDIIFLF